MNIFKVGREGKGRVREEGKEKIKEGMKKEGRRGKSMGETGRGSKESREKRRGGR